MIYFVATLIVVSAVCSGAMLSRMVDQEDRKFAALYGGFIGAWTAFYFCALVQIAVRFIA